MKQAQSSENPLGRRSIEQAVLRYELNEMSERLEKIGGAMDDALKILQSPSAPQVAEPPHRKRRETEFSERNEVSLLLSLPDHLRMTMEVVKELGKVTSEHVAQRTLRAKSLESSYLNQLTRLGYLKKERVSRKIFFSLHDRGVPQQETEASAPEQSPEGGEIGS